MTLNHYCWHSSYIIGWIFASCASFAASVFSFTVWMRSRTYLYEQVLALIQQDWARSVLWNVLVAILPSGSAVCGYLMLEHGGYSLLYLQS